MKSAKEIFDIRFFVRLGCIAVIIALAVFLYFFGKQRTLYVDNWSTEIDGTSYRAVDWAMVKVDDGKEQEYSPRQRRGLQLRGTEHTIYITTEDDNFNEVVLDPPTFTLPSDNSILSLPALVAGLDAEKSIQPFIPEPSPVQAGSAEAEAPAVDEFGSMTSDF